MIILHFVKMRKIVILILIVFNFVLQVHHFVYISILHLDVVCHSINGLPIPKIEGKKICVSYISIVTTKLQYLDV